MIPYDETVGDLNIRWWLERDPDERANQLKAAYKAIEDNDASRQEMNLHHLRLYGNMPVEGIEPSVLQTGVREPRVTLNIIANVCDFATNRIGKHRPLPRPLPIAGNYSLRRKAKLLGRFFEAQFSISRVWEQLPRMFLDATVFGTGVLKIYVADRKIKVERVFPSEMLVDHHEALYGEPRTLYQRKWISRDVLMETFAKGRRGEKRAKIEEMIESAGRALEDQHEGATWVSDDGVNDQVLVVEAWHLPSGTGAGDGLHTISVDSGELFSEEWTYDYFPFVFLRWKERLRGFWGVGLAEELNGIQVEINRMLLKIQAAYQLMARPLILLPAGSKIVKTHMTNEIGTFVPYVGEKPEVWTPPTFHPEFYAHLERLYQKAFEIAGMSQDSVAPQFDAGESGVARQYRFDIETDRFSRVAHAYEQVALDIAVQMVDRAKELAATGKFTTVAQQDKNTIAAIDWSEIDMQADEYQLVVRPQSALPSLPGPRIDRVIMLLEAGLLDPKVALKMIDMPDLEAEMDLEGASADDIDRMIENMLDEGEYEPPEPYMDLNLAMMKVQDAYNKGRRDQVDPERLGLLQKFLIQAHMLEQKAAVEQMKVSMMAAGGGAGTLPPGPGAPPATGPDGAPPMAAQGGQAIQ